VFIGVEVEAVAILCVEGFRVGGPHEISTDCKHTFHARYPARTAIARFEPFP
jgi:hypothetical protein